jgi:HK97 family phage portal protein
MNFFNLLKNNKESRSISTVATAERGSWFKDIANKILGKVNGDFNTKSPELASIIYTCIAIKTNNISRLPLGLWQDTGNEKVKLVNHEFYPTLRYNPQNYYSVDNWLKIIITHLNLCGNAFAYINHRKRTLDIIHPDLIKDIKIKGDTLWYYLENGSVIKFDEILHFKGISKDGITGLNPIASLRTELNLNHKSAKTLDSLYSKNVYSQKYIQLQQGVTTKNDNIKNMADSFKDDYAGAEQAGEVIVVPPLFELKELKMSVDDIKFLETNRYTRNAIAALYGIPEFMVSEQMYAGNFENQSLILKNTLASDINIIQSELNNKLLTYQERNRGCIIEFDVHGLVETDLMTKVNALKILKDAGVATPNECRKALNMPVIDDENMNKTYMQLQYVPIQGNTFENAKQLPPTSLDKTQQD